MRLPDITAVPLALALSALGCGGSQQPPPAAADAEQEEASAGPELEPLEPARVVNAMRSNEVELRKCFFRAPSASGFVRIGFSVDKSGAVQKPAVKHSTIKNPDVESCLTSRVGELRFGELAQAGKAEWTYVYRLAEPMTEKQKKSAAKKREKEKDEEDQPGIVIDPNSAGFVEPEKIHDVIHSGYRLFARCYRDGFDRDTALTGTIVFRFVIGRAGRVTRVLDGASDLPDRRVIDCVAETFYAMEFPKSPGGDVNVMYRLQLQ